MKLIFIYGPPAVGKLTVANELAKLTGYKVFHNHVTFDLAREYFPPFSPAFASVVAGTRLLVFEAAATHGFDGLVFTFVYSRPEDDPYVTQIVEVVERHGGEVCFVALGCPPQVLAERVGHADRRSYGKLIDPDRLRILLETRDLVADVPHGHSLRLDTSTLAASDAARRIADQFGLPCLRVREMEGHEGDVHRRLRLAALADSPDAFGRTHAEAVQLPDDHWSEQIARAAADPDAVQLLAERGGTAAGIAYCRIAPDDRSLAQIFGMWVAPHARRTGMATALLEYALRWARTRGATAAELSVTEGNEPATALYAAAGFTDTGHREPLREGSDLKSIAMRRAL